MFSPRHLRGFVAAAGLLICIASAVPAGAAGLLVADGGFGGRLEMKEQDVRVVVNNGVAVTEVTQVFVNQEDRIVEALYTFPVPKQASVANFSMWINGKEMIGEVVEKQRAREIYESYKQTRRDPGLLEQVDYKRFEMRIFPIPARAEQKVMVTYYQELDVDHDWATYVYPLATAADGRKADQRTTGRFSLTLDVKSEVPIAAMESPSHADSFVVAKHVPTYYQASMEVDGGDLSRDVVLAYHLKRPKSGLDMITSKTEAEDGYFQLTLTAGDELAEDDFGMDYVFVVDVSGSMANDGKLAASRRAVESFVEALSPKDRFELLAFNVQPRVLFQELRTYDDNASQATATFLDDQTARGGTVLRPAVETAYRYRDADRQLNVVILSDGMTEVSEQRELVSLINSRPPGTRVFCIGVGNEVNRPLLRQLATEAGGLAAFLSQGDDFGRQAESFRRKLLRPAMANVQLDFAGVDVYDLEPKVLPDLYHGAPVRVYGRYRGDGVVDVQVQAEVLGKPLSQSFETKLPDRNTDNPEIERTWAWHRVQALLEEQRRSGSGDDFRAKVVELCEDYSIVSEYASFIVLENDGEYQRWNIDRKNRSRIARDRAARSERRERLRELRDQAVADLGPKQSLPGAGDRANQLVPRADEFASRTRPRRPSMDFNVDQPGGASGGGAIDPFSGAVLLTMAGMAGWSRRRRLVSRLPEGDE